MKIAFLTVGPQGSGKSTFCNRVVETFPEIVLVSRDTILAEMFGSAWLSPYTSQHIVGQEKMWEAVAQQLSQDRVMLILDCWNGYPEERREIASKLRSHGAQKVVALHFITPEKTCIEWFIQKPKPGNQPKKDSFWEERRRENYRSDYRLFHSMPVELSQGFDAIWPINPLKHIAFRSLAIQGEG